ncbi:hypothetical protein Leryth_009317 [Lithospermum erythrorhizon]|nr:hypothetical protein Leryth_009317 [Lithospermum erythrorhizon]
MSSLQELHLPRCNLAYIPLSLPFVNFTSLSVLELSNNGFNSTLPSWLFNLSSLTQLDLSSNNFHGVLPGGFSKLRSLERLDLSSNFGIEGSLSSMGKLCNLKTLKMNSNKLTGEITKFVDSLSECSNKTLETLDLGQNDLTGDLPTSIGLLESLQYLLLWHNSFTGSVPETIGKLSSLKQLYLSDNKMSGNITENLGQLSSLIDLDLSENPWGGIITEAHMMNLSSLKEFSIGIKLSNNITLGFNISPKWIPPFQLKLITIQSCKLGPKFPGWIKNQKELSNIIFNTAGISDTFPDWFLELNLELNELDVAYNELSGKVPNSFRFVEYSNVDLSSNLFEGPLPLWSSNVSTLYLRDNKFSGPIPPDIGTIMPFLSDIDISRNSLNGSIPMSIADMNGLVTLVISSNFLSGKVPDFFEKLPMLLIVDMSNNSLSGQIPRSLGSLNSIKFLILSGNNLSGELPSSLRNCTKLASIDLGDNRLSGTIPSWIGESMSSLLILRLRNNSFTGKIPAQLCNLSDLHILDLSENILSGALHRCIGNLTGFKVELTQDDTNKIYEGKLHVVKQGRMAQYSSTLYLVNSIDLSNNKLHGEIPEEVTLLSVLWTLNLSMNHLTGNIPSDIEKLTRLETLDLSWNELSGHIPTTMSSLTFLNHLNLSFNNFSGRIPTGKQFETLDPSIYKGNTFLCGDRLNITCGSKAQTPDGNNENAEDEDRFNTLAFYGVIGVGFFTGFWLVCGTLLLKKDCRDAYFYFLLKMYDRILAFPASIHCVRNWKMPANERAEINQSITRYVVNTSA